MNAMMNTDTAVNKVGIIKTPNQPMYNETKTPLPFEIFHPVGKQCLVPEPYLIVTHHTALHKKNLFAFLPAFFL